MCVCLCVFMHVYACMYIFIFIYVCMSVDRAIGPMSRVFVNGPEDRGSIPGRVIPKILSTQHYQVRIKGKVEQSWEWSSSLPYTSV